LEAAYISQAVEIVLRVAWAAASLAFTLALRRLGMAIIAKREIYCH
jgi:hypothetical protein